MNQETIINNLDNFDVMFIKQTSNLLETIFNEPVKISAVESQVFDLEALRDAVGVPALRLDFVISEKKHGFIYFVQGSVIPELTEYLNDQGENTPSIPNSMQMVMDVSEQISMIKKQCFDEFLKQSVNFENPALSLWDGKVELSFDNGILTTYEMQIGAEHRLTLVRLVPGVLAREYFEQAHVDNDMNLENEEFDEFPDTDQRVDAQQSIEFIHDLELLVTVELGRVTMTLKDMLALGPGSIVELNKFAGEPVEVYVNNKKFAEGEVVVIDQNFAVRITSLVAKRDRFASLRV